MMLTPETRRLGWLAYVVVGLIIAGFVALREAHAQARFDCHDLAAMVGAAADLRDADASLEKSIRLVRERNNHRTAPELEAIEREFRRVWKERRKRFAAMSEVYKRCRAQLGDMGADS